MVHCCLRDAICCSDCVWSVAPVRVYTLSIFNALAVRVVKLRSTGGHQLSCLGSPSSTIYRNMYDHVCQDALPPAHAVQQLHWRGALAILHTAWKF